MRDRRRLAGAGQSWPEDDLRWREHIQRVALQWGVDVRLVKPCVAVMHNEGQQMRNQTCYILATEWRRLGRSESEALHLAYAWRELNPSPLPAREIETTVRSAYHKRREYGCRGVLSIWCIGREECPYYKAYVGGSKAAPGRTTAQDLEELGWLDLLTLGEREVYRAVVAFESFRGLRPGGRLIADLRQIGAHAHVAHTTVRRALLVMHHLGLVTFTPGQPRGRGLPPTGSTIYRAVPIPDPPRANLTGAKRSGAAFGQYARTLPELPAACRLITFLMSPIRNQKAPRRLRGAP